MNTPFLKNLTLAIATTLVAGVSLRANTVSVEEVSVGANETVWIDSSKLGNNLHVYACVVNLKVNNIATVGFCIDPWHWSASGPLPYSVEELANAPKSATDSTANPMGAAAATKIEELWAKYESTAVGNNVVAAALQIEIWQVVAAAVAPNGTFKLDSVDNDSAAVYSALAGMDTFLAGATATTPKAFLVAVTGRGQDYVIPNVPEAGATVALLGVALAGLGLARKKFQAA